MQKAPFGRLAHDCRLHMQRTTQRLVLQAATIDLAKAELSSLESLSKFLDATVHPDWYGQGLAIEMVSELVAFAFEDVRVGEIIGNTTRGNVASCKIFKNLGFVETESHPNSEAVRFLLTRQSVPA